MAKLPEPDWLVLSEASCRALAFFSADDPAVVRRALVAEIYEGRIVSCGRREKRITRLERILWEPSSGWAVDWEENNLVRRLRFGGRYGYEIEDWITDARVLRKDLENWFKRAAVDNVLQFTQKAARETGLVPEQGKEMLATVPRRQRQLVGKALHGARETDDRPLRNRGRKPERTEKTVEAMLAAIARGKRTKQSLIEEGATEALASEYGVSRTTIRSALDKLSKVNN